jgi:hypothetical protein
MPRLTRWFIRTALVHLALGFTFGALMLFNKGVLVSVWLWRLLPLHVELVLLGWTVQLAMGVAFWILPRFRLSRGNERAAWAAFVLINAGVWIAGIGAMLGASPIITLIGRLSQVGAVIAFVVHAWPRVKPLGV